MIARLLNNERFRNRGAQALLLGGFVLLLFWVYANAAENLRVRGIKGGWDFLWRSAGFPISESVLPYDPSDTFLWALVVGVANTLFLSALVIALATVLGTGIGLARRSRNPLFSSVAGCFVTTTRNTPVIVQLLFWYALLTAALPAPRQALHPLPGVFLSLRGVYLPALELDGPLLLFWSVLALIVALLVTVSIRAARRGISGWIRFPSLLLATVAAVPLVAAFTGTQVALDMPALKGLNFTGGMRLSSEFTALLVGLVLYTSAFIGEIIRGGIDAVSRGQWEAGRAIGLSERQTLFKVIVPQALRVIIPPMTSQYLSTAKNTTLALAVGYPELGLVVGTVINQTGQAIEGLVVLLSVFLAISLSVSVVMNWVNRKVALVQR